MKITPPKSAAAPRLAERPQPSTAKSGNTGIVPPSQAKPTDSFQPTQATGKGGTPGTTGVTAPKLSPSTTGTTYTLSPNLEPYRELFDKEGERIARLPIQMQEEEIKLTTSKLAEKLKGIATADEIGMGLEAAVAYFRRSTTTEDPQYYAMAAKAAADTSFGPSPSTGGGDFSTSITRDPSSTSEENTLRPGRQEPEETLRLPRRHRRF